MCGLFRYWDQLPGIALRYAYAAVKPQRFDHQIVAGIVVIFVAAGSWLRFSYLDWDGWQQFHPDERGIWYVAQTIQLPSNPLDALKVNQSP
jgi:hypothetical protein